MKKVRITTPHGDMVAELYSNETPKTVDNFLKLTKEGFYNDLNFHRVIPEFMVQGGCPNGRGDGGPGYNIDCEVKGENQFHDKGVLSMAHAGPNTGGSQFFICHNRHNTQHLDGVHTAFGKVIENLDVVDKIKTGDMFSVNEEN
tara:strand:+ start:3293 stop:3724 length:432 start_codon:yes stop_codon:yes gene_type:complete